MATRSRSGAAVRRSADGRRFIKTARTPELRAELADERDRLRWLAGAPIPVPEVLDWFGTGDRSVLVTAAIPGVPACELVGEAAEAAVPAPAALLRSLHDLSVDDCPFDRRLAIVLPSEGGVTVTDREVHRPRCAGPLSLQVDEVDSWRPTFYRLLDEFF